MSTTYEFKTTCTMKEYNNKHWWIDSGYIRPITICTENLNEALYKYRGIVEEKYYINISKNALKNKNPMYIDLKNGESKQIGYVITASTEFEDRTACKWSKQYIDLWVTIKKTEYIDFDELLDDKTVFYL